MTREERDIVRSCFSMADPDLEEGDYVSVLEAYTASAAAAAMARRKRGLLREVVKQIEARIKDGELP